MKIDMTQKLVDFRGKPVIEKEKTTLGDAAIKALMAITADEKPDGAESFKNYQLADKVHDNAECELTVEETAKIKERIGMVFGPAIVGPAYLLIEKAADKKEK